MAKQSLVRERNAAHFPAFETDAPPEPMPALAPFTALVKRLSEAYGPSGSEQVRGAPTPRANGRRKDRVKT